MKLPNLEQGSMQLYPYVLPLSNYAFGKEKVHLR